MRLAAYWVLLAVGCASSAPKPESPPSEPQAAAEKRAPIVESPPAPPPDPGRANLDPDDDSIAGPPDPIADCEERLTRAGVEFHAGSIKVKQQPGGHFCGAPQIVIYDAGPTGVAYNAKPALTCQLALALARFERLVQDEAEKSLGARVTRINQGGTYSCRKMARFSLVSEHSYANAIDIRSLTLADGRTLSVKRHFGGTAPEPPTPEARFLRTVARRAFAEDVFSTVLTPFWDALHADHFHFDQGRYRVDATTPRG
jgi:hypothetical protein